MANLAGSGGMARFADWFGSVLRGQLVVFPVQDAPGEGSFGSPTSQTHPAETVAAASWEAAPTPMGVTTWGEATGRLLGCRVRLVRDRCPTGTRSRWAEATSVNCDASGRARGIRTDRLSHR